MSDIFTPSVEKKIRELRKLCRQCRDTYAELTDKESSYAKSVEATLDLNCALLNICLIRKKLWADSKKTEVV